MSNHLQHLLEEKIFDQYPLFDEGQGLPLPATSDTPKKRIRRKRGYDTAVLRYIGYYRFVTTHQVIYRFFVLDGKGPRYGFRLIANLVSRGLVSSSPLDPQRGSVSRSVLSLTETGWLALGLPQPRDSKQVVKDAIRDYRLQFADMMLEREAEGWTLVPDDRAFTTLRAWALSWYRGRALTGTDIVFRDRLERLAPFRIPLRMLIHRARGDVRLLLPVRRGKSFAKTIESLPSLTLFPPLTFEIVSADLDLARKAEDYLRRWAERTRHRYHVVMAPHFRDRPHPAQVPIPERSLYTLNGVPAPKLLL